MHHIACSPLNLSHPVHIEIFMLCSHNNCSSVSCCRESSTHFNQFISSFFRFADSDNTPLASSVYIYVMYQYYVWNAEGRHAHLCKSIFIPHFGFKKRLAKVPSLLDPTPVVIHAMLWFHKKLFIFVNPLVRSRLFPFTSKISRFFPPRVVYVHMDIWTYYSRYAERCYDLMPKSRMTRDKMTKKLLKMSKSFDPTW
jgi:hypothetical protein